MDRVQSIAPEVERAEGEAMVRDPTGLHARPAVKLTRLAKGFAATIRVRADAGGEWVNAKSPNRVMKLKARHGEWVAFEAEGPDAGDAVAALIGLVERNFDE
jgi:phosphocarrier protein HPr